jgi:amino acid adenylation domain-containing protein
MSTQDIQDIYPLSPMQQGMLFHCLYAPESGVYVERTMCTLRGRLDVVAFERAWQRVIERHDILRCGFVWEGLDQPLQVVYRHVDVPFRKEDWQHLSAEEQRARFDEAQQVTLDLSDPPLIRLSLFRIAPDAYRFLWVHHHLLIDGWSLPLLLKEVLDLYEAFRQGRDPYLPPAQPYRDYISWLQKQDTAKAEAFWRRYLDGFTAPTPLGVDLPPGSGAARAEYEGDETIGLSSQTTSRLQSLARQFGVTLNNLVQGAWALLLSRYSQEEDIVFGVTVSGRPVDLEGADRILGIFINTLPLRVSVDPQAALAAWLHTLQAQQVEMQQYEYSALVQIQGWSQVPTSQPLFESILVFENYPVDASLREQLDSLRMDDFTELSKTNFPITLVATMGDTLLLKIAYDHRRFDRPTIQRMLGHLHTILQGMVDHAGQPLGQIALLTPDEREQVVVTWNNTAADYPQDLCLHQWFEDQVRQTPDAVAAVLAAPRDARQSLTYRELNERANLLAHYLRGRGVGPEVLVGLCVERSLEALVGILGVLKAGGAYVPLDPSYPAERLTFMVQDSGISLLLTQQKLLSALSELSALPHPASMILLDADWDLIARESRGDNLQSEVTPDSLAYVIYTSGSTGKPKGTLLQHRGVCNFCRGMGRIIDVNSSTRLLQFASLSFDASVPELFMPLVHGGTVIMASRETLASVPDLLQLMNDERVTTAILPPSLLRILPVDGLPLLGTLVSAGEACPPEVATQWSSGRRFFNGYGPTEATVGVSLYPVRELPRGALTVPIGRPIQNMRLYVLDSQRRPLPVGVPGELHIGGVGLARGYLNRPELTAEKFIADPFAQGRGARLYRSGDLVRYLPDGNLEFLGRIDQQVKIRGFRVELGEIEAVLEQYPGVRQAVVMAREDVPGGQRLVAYLVPEGSGELARADLAAWARSMLPEYMVPSAFVVMDALPLTPNAKVDRKALPAPEGAQMAAGAAYVAPRTPEQELLAEIWARVLSVERVGMRDNFFDLGGHSLLATQLVSRVRDAFAVELPLRALFEHPTVESLALEVEEASGRAASGAGPALVPVPREADGRQPLSFAQQRLWFLDQLEPQGAFYNIPSALRLRGPLDHEALEWSLNEMARRHEALRTSFVNQDGKPAQVISPVMVLQIPVEDLCALPEAEREARAVQLATEEAQQPFDLTQVPLLRVRLLRLAEQDHVALITLHHIISDGWSMGVFIREITALYNARVQGQPSPLGPLPIQYADYAQWQRSWLQGEELDRQLGYWKDQLQHAPDLLSLPTDHPRPAMQSFRGTTVSCDLPGELSQALKDLSRQEGVTLFMTLLAAFQALLHRYTAEEDICVGTPIANRRMGELEGLIGFFVNTLVMRTDMSGEPSFRDLLLRVREAALGAYAHQDLPFEMLVEALQPRRDLSHTPLFQVMFVLQNAPLETAEIRAAEGGPLVISAIQAESGTAKFDLSVVIEEGAAGLGCSFEYNTDLFDSDTIERMMGHWRTLLEGIAADPDESIGSLPVLTPGERQQMLVEWNQTAADYAADLCAHELVAAHAQRIPDAIALTFEGRSLTYKELDQRARKLGAYLQKLDVGPDTLVGLCTERSMEMIVGILGVLKAGGAYVPLDPTYPVERLAFMLEDSGVSVLLTQSHLAEGLPHHQARVVRLDTDWEQIVHEAGPETIGPASTVGPENLAYVIYTSGSTGRPKGTMLRHRGLCNLVAAQRKLFGIADGTRVLQFSPLSFDASVWETFMALGNGGTLCLARQDRLAFGPELLSILKEDGVNIATLPPSVLKVLEPQALPELRTIVAAGEACGPELVERWAPGRKFFNAYGPTETTVCASAALCEPGAPGIPPIGKPIANTRIYVLDARQQPVPIGVPGELCVGGVSLAAGYWKRPELTAERFLPDPFASLVPGARDPRPAVARIYRTGDLVRYRRDGNIEFLGRIDHQVKLRGVRIELGEIETVLAQHPGVREVVVLVREDRVGNQWLVSYIVPRPAEPGGDGSSLGTGLLRSYLRERLPEYMVPTHYILLEAMPLTPNGKVDRKALPAPEGERPELAREYVAPRSETETKLAQLYADLLGVERVGLYDDFFELGGHSLLATQLVSRLRQAFGVELPLRSLFEEPTIATLALAVDQAIQAQAAGLAQQTEFAQTSAGVQTPEIVPLSREGRRVKSSTLKGLR